ncbi:MAG: hypothetical protein NTY80_01230 [candidate division SR1 bacterium]|nr:hypothetical protein [candidate division SR1 bacterium]
MVDIEKQAINHEKKDKENTISDVSSEKKDLNNLQTEIATKNLKTEIIDKTEANIDWSYDLIKDSKMYLKLQEIGKTNGEIKEFAEKIDRVVRKFLDQELIGFSNGIKNSISVGIQFAMMETLTKQGNTGSIEFFNTFSAIKSESAGAAFKGLYGSFGKLGSANGFFVLANKVQNLTWYLSDKKNIITSTENIPELTNPNQFKNLLNKNIWSDQKQIDKIDITTLLTLNSSKLVDIHSGEDELKKIINNDKISGVITKKSIAAIEKSLNAADDVLDTRGEYKNKSSELVDKIAGFLDITIPFFGNLGEMIGMSFPTDVFGERKDRPVIDFVLGVLGFRGGVKGLHREYIKEKLQDLHIDNAFVAASYAHFQKNNDATLTNDTENSTWKMCALSVSDSTQEPVFKDKVPADYVGLKKSLVENIATAKINPIMVIKFAPEVVTNENGIQTVDIAKIDNKDDFVDRYLKYIIPLLVDPTDDFIMSKNTNKESFALAVIGGLVGDKYFIEGVNIGLINAADFKELSKTPITIRKMDYDNYSLRNLTDTGLLNCKMSEDEYQKFVKKVIIISKEVEINPEDILKVMVFETGGTFDPSKKNIAGSGSTGLIQFMPDTAKGLGTTTSDLAKMTAFEQLDYVQKYFLPYKGRLKTLEDVYLAVFTPKFVGKPLNYVGYSKPSNEYTQNNGFDTNKDGEITVGEITETIKNRTNSYVFFDEKLAEAEVALNIQIEAKTLNDIILVGDSHAGGIMGMGGFAGKTLYHNGYDSGQILDIIKKEKIDIQKHKSLLLVAGTNDITKGHISKLKDNLLAIQKEISPVQLVLSTLSYAKTENIVSHAKVDQVNAIFRQFAQENSLPLIDIKKEITLSSKEYQDDELHLDSSGYAKIAKNIAAHIIGTENIS